MAATWVGSVRCSDGGSMRVASVVAGGGGTGDSGGEHTDHLGLCQGKSSKSSLIGPFQRPPWVGEV